MKIKKSINKSMFRILIIVAFILLVLIHNLYNKNLIGYLGLFFLTALLCYELFSTKYLEITDKALLIVDSIFSSHKVLFSDIEKVFIGKIRGTKVLCVEVNSKVKNKAYDTQILFGFRGGWLYLMSTNYL